MKFGPVPVREAGGAILAHTHRLASGALKKGRRLTASDLRALLDDGHSTVIVARLEPQDVPEDEAAEQLGAACAGPGVRAAPAKTGRVNLFSDRRGLLLAPKPRVDAVNLVHGALTVATLPEHSLVQAGELVGTAKIIPFAASQEALQRTVRAASQPGPLIQVAALHSLRVTLILTELPGVSESQLDRSTESQRRRIEHLGGQLVQTLRCAHSEQGVHSALQQALRDQAQLIMVLGASAIVDPRDVIPEGLRRAGGVVEHVGMPVDPGNLMMLGHLQQRPVLGVPGCARSLKRSGFDIVLERLVAGLQVTREDIMRLGSGGLLAEITSRPAPRLGGPEAHSSHTPRVAGVVLAAGLSRRMGPDNKLLSQWRGQALVAHVVTALRASNLSSVYVVTGHDAAAVQESLSNCAVQFVHNPDYAQGMSTSLRAGLSALGPEVDGAVIALADMPWIQAGHVNTLLRAFDPEGAQDICVPTFERKRGNPVLWASKYFFEMRRLSGDMGARSLLRTHSDAVLEVPMPDPATNIDVDTPQALQDLRQRGARRP